jgi:glycosyltransferase involved in cell wall biosynthesis
MMVRRANANDRTRVVHVALQLDTGGMEKLLVEFARHANRACFAVRFLCLGSRGPVAHEIEACGWPVTALNIPPGLRPSLVAQLAGLFRRWEVDVVHSHNTKPLLYAAPAARLAGTRRVLHTRHGQRFGASRRDTLLFRLAASLADRVVCVSNDSARLSRREGVAVHRIATVWNGIDVRRFGYLGPAALGPAVMVGRLSPEKDVGTLLRAAACVVRTDPAFRLEIAGDGPCRSELERLACQLELGEKVRFLGEVKDIPTFLARASLFVLPSLTEGISLTLLEAMARGLPVVATRVGGNPEVVIESETGLLVPPAAPEELAEAMRCLWRDPGRAVAFGQAGRRRIERHFDVRRMVGDYEALYLNATRTRRISRPQVHHAS